MLRWTRVIELATKAEAQQIRGSRLLETVGQEKIKVLEAHVLILGETH